MMLALYCTDASNRCTVLRTDAHNLRLYMVMEMDGVDGCLDGFWLVLGWLWMAQARIDGFRICLDGFWMDL